MKVTIRTAGLTDLTSVLSILNEVILNTTASYDYEPKSYEELSDWYQQKVKENVPLIVAEHEGKVLGFGTYGPFRSKVGYQFTVEHSIYVKPAYHGKGIGSQLLIELIELARKNGLKNMIAGIDASNNGSIAFHEKHGFELIGQFNDVGFKFEKWLSLVFMQLKL